jgi:hypothetical protein
MLGAIVSMLVLVAWPSLYAAYPHPGTAPAARRSTPHEYNSSPRAWSHVASTLVLAGVITGIVTTGGIRSLLAAWVGLSASLLISFSLRGAAWNSNLAPLAVVLYPIQTLTFLLPALVSLGFRQALRPHAG